MSLQTSVAIVVLFIIASHGLILKLAYLTVNGLTSPPRTMAEKTIKVLFFAINSEKSLKISISSVIRAIMVTGKTAGYVFRIDIILRTDGEKIQDFISVREISLAYQNRYRSLIQVRINNTLSGSKDCVLEAMASVDSEYLLILERNIKVSPFIFKYLIASLDFLATLTDLTRDRIGSISLFHPKFSSPNQRWINLQDCTTNLLQDPIGWGHMFFPWHLRNFLKFVNEFGNNDPVVPNLFSNRWPNDLAWEKYLIRFFYERNLFTMSTLHQSNYTMAVDEGGTEWGDHYQSMQDLKMILMPQNICYPSRIDKVIDMHGHEIRLNKLNTIRHDAKSFDGCTLVIPTCTRKNNINILLRHYTQMSFIKQVIIVDQICNGYIDQGHIPKVMNQAQIIIKHMAVNDLSNRYLPFQEIRYDCIISSDDDWMVDHQLLKFMYETWKGNFFNHLIGHYRLARSHVALEDGSYEYTNPSSSIAVSGASIMLPGGGSIFHKKYLSLYHSSEFREGRNIVKRKVNCEDLLLNFVVSSRIKQGPVIIHYWQNMLEIAFSGLWNRPDHKSARATCIQDFITLYGDVLKHTVSEFRIGQRYGYAYVPGLNDLKML